MIINDLRSEIVYLVFVISIVCVLRFSPVTVTLIFPPPVLTAEQYDTLVFVNIDVVDGNGLLRADAATPLSLQVEGDARLLAFGGVKALHRKGYARTVAAVRSFPQSSSWKAAFVFSIRNLFS